MVKSTATDDLSARKSTAQINGDVDAVPVSLYTIAYLAFVIVAVDQTVSAASISTLSFVVSTVTVLDANVAPPAV